MRLKIEKIGIVDGVFVIPSVTLVDHSRHAKLNDAFITFLSGKSAEFRAGGMDARCDMIRLEKMGICVPLFKLYEQTDDDYVYRAIIPPNEEGLDLLDCWVSRIYFDTPSKEDAEKYFSTKDNFVELKKTIDLL